MTDRLTQLERASVGLGGGEIGLETQAEVAAAVRAMAETCRREIAVVSRHLDPRVYDDGAVVEAFKELALSSRSARIRMLVMDPAPMLRNGHRLLDLTHRLPSTLKIRVPGREHRKFNEAWLLADTLGYVRLRFGDRYEGSADFNDRRGCRDLLDRFEEMWEHSKEDPNLRRLAI